MFAVLLLAGCPPRVSIEKINRDPGRYAGKEVTVAGKVVDSYGVLGRGAFQIDDGTGALWVLAGHYGVPEAGAKLAVTGNVEQGFTLVGRNFATILRETERRRWVPGGLPHLLDQPTESSLGTKLRNALLNTLCLPMMQELYTNKFRDEYTLEGH
jgi:hypothetical protein